MKRVVICAALLIASTVRADEGLFFEHSASADGVTVRRMRDTANGAVCYVASGVQVGDSGRLGRNVAISCIAGAR